MSEILLLRIEKLQNNCNDWGNDMKNHMFLQTSAELLALAGHITFKMKAIFLYCLNKIILTTNQIFHVFSIYHLRKIVSIFKYMQRINFYDF